MAIGKKAVFFTILSILFLGVLYFSLSLEESQRLKERATVSGSRVKSIDYFIGDLEQDIERGAYIGMFRALLGIQQYITTNGKFINDTDRTFEEIMLNGTIHGDYISVMNQTELSVWIAKIQNEAAKIGIVFHYEINGVHLHHQNPDRQISRRVSSVWNKCDIVRETVQLIPSLFAREMIQDLKVYGVHCGVGNSVKMRPAVSLRVKVHCRIGSSETQVGSMNRFPDVHCRVRNSETPR